MSSAGTKPASRSRSLAMMASRSSSVKRSFLFRATINRFPRRASSKMVWRSALVRSWSTTNTSRSARGGQVDRLDLACPALGAGLAESGRIRQQQRSFHTLDDVGMHLAAAGRAHRGPGLARRAAESALISDVLPTGPVPITTTWNSVLAS